MLLLFGVFLLVMLVDFGFVVYLGFGCLADVYLFFVMGFGFCGGCALLILVLFSVV